MVHVLTILFQFALQTLIFVIYSQRVSYYMVQKRSFITMCSSVSFIRKNFNTEEIYMSATVGVASLFDDFHVCGEVGVFYPIPW